MKKKIFILTILFSLFSSLIVRAQDYCEAWDWDWTITDTDNWMWLKSGGGEGTMYYFLGTSNINNISALDAIAESNDYLSENGWVLLYKDFGCSPLGSFGVKFPYFILYNKYTGLLRLFTFLYNQEFHESANGGIVTLKFKSGSKITSLLTHTNKMSLTSSRYHDGSSLPNDIGTVFLDGDGDGEDTFVTGYWCVADFPMAFDANTPTQTGNGVYAGDYQLYFDFDEIKESTIEMVGEFEFVTQTYAGNIDEDDITHPLDDPNTQEDESKIKQYLEGAAKVTKNMPSESDLRKLFENEKTEFTRNNTTTVGNTKFSESFKFTMEDLSKSDNEFMNFLLGVSKYTPVVGKYLGAAVSVVDFFSGKANKTPQKVEIMPTISKGNLTLSGTITNKASLGNVTLELPGTPHLQDEQTPYYDCPLGVLGLEEEPEIEIKRVNFAYKQFAEDDSYEWGCRDGQYIQEYKSLKIKDDLKIALNKSANVDLIELKAALVCIDDTNHWKYFAEDRYYYGKRASDCNYYYVDAWNVNPFFDFLNSGVFVVSGKNEYSTAFIDVENFKNTTIFCSKNAFVYLKVYAILKANDQNLDDTPILFSASYKLTEPTSTTYYCSDYENLNQYIFPFTQAQLSYTYNMESDIVDIISNVTINNGSYSNFGVETSGIVSANATNGNILFNAYDKVRLNPGFTCSPSLNYSFSANINKSLSLNAGLIDINVIQTNNTSINSIVTPYFEGMDCDCGLGSLKSATLNNSNNFTNLIEEAENSSEAYFGPTIYPNPASNVLNINSAFAFIGKVEIININGIVVHTSAFNSQTLSIDISDLAQGLYFVNIYSENKVYRRKIIKK